MNNMAWACLVFLHIYFQLASCESCYSQIRINLLKANPNCGDGQCYCKENIAMCVGDLTRSTIPFINEEIIELHAQCYNLANTSSITFLEVNKGLKVLNLNYNNIQRIDGATFAHFHQLREVHMDNNPLLNTTDLWTALVNIPDKSNVQEIHLTGNKLLTIPLRLFSNFTSLKFLRCAYNRIQHIDSKDAEPIKALTVLDLQYNHIGWDSLVFCRNNTTGDGSLFPSLTQLYLRSNHISLNKSYHWNCLEQLTELNLRDNSIQEINITTFSNLKSLRILNLKKNWISKIIPGVFPPKLESLYLQQNEIIPLPPFLCEQNSTNSWNNSLTYLNLSANHIKRIIINKWDCLDKLETLDLGKNDVAWYNNDTFYPLMSLKHLYLNDMIRRLHYADPTAFRTPHDSLQTLILRNNRIDTRNTNIHVIFQSCSNVTFLDISYFLYGLTEWQLVDALSAMKHLRKLNAVHINIKSFPVSLLMAFPSLECLNMNENHMTTIEFPPAFNDAKMNFSLRELHVADCAINILDEKAFPQAIAHNLRTLDASRNEFACNCNTTWLIDKVNASGYIFGIKLLHWPQDYQCRSPSSLVGKQLKLFHPDEICNLLFSYLVVGGVVLAVVGFIVAVFYWRRWYIQYYCCYRYTRHRKAQLINNNPERRSLINQIKYDGYIVYDSEDYDFVRHGFLNVMEVKLNYKLYVWDRDAEFGALVDVILDGMFASKQIIIIVSNNSIKSALCKFQVNVAVDMSIRLRRSCVLLVVREDTDFKQISKSWCVLLARHTKAYWEDNCPVNDIKRKLFEQTVTRHCGTPLSTHC